MSWATLLQGAADWLTLPDCTGAEALAHLGQCATCPSRRDFTEDELMRANPMLGLLFRRAPMTSWCGYPGKAEAGVSCGCLIGREAHDAIPDAVTITIKGRRMVADGKAAKVADCTQHRW